MQESELRTAIARTVREIEPDARVILYGSRARGEGAPDSDWDLLVLLPRPVDTERERTVRRRIYELEWASDQVLTVIVKSQAAWNRPRSRRTPFHANVSREGVLL